MRGPDFKDAEISGLTADSRLVEPGFLFAALEGSRAHGRDFVPQAIERGAAALLAGVGTDIDAEIPVLAAANPRRVYARMCAVFYGAQPDHLAAVTGTNGKTSVAEFTRQIWAALGHPAASIGTLGVITPNGREGGSLTTPDPAQLHARLAALAHAGIDHAILEASSHGLDQYRLDGARIGVAAFTNLTRDHLDYHGDMDAYLAAKRRLFAELLADAGTAVINAHTPMAEQLIAAVPAGRRVLTFGVAAEDDLQILSAEPVSDGIDLALRVGGAEHALRLPLIGGFQATNAVCALAVVLADGAEADPALAALAQLQGVPGRVEFVGAHAGGGVYVDYAHTPDALANVLAALRPHAAGRVIAVFGCGGDRDTGKRAEMGSVARRLADAAIVTDDNPRTEDAAAIRRQVLEGCPEAVEIGDRAQAIAAGVGMLGAGDILVIAGKGHEEGQIVGDEVLPFDDVQVARRALKEAGP